MRSLFPTAAALAALIVGGRTAVAAPVNAVAFHDGKVLDVVDTVGTGASTAFAVVNFADGLDVAYQYNFTGAVTAGQELSDLDAADPNLTVTFSPPSQYGRYVANLQYGSDQLAAGTHYFAFYTGSYSPAAASAADNQGTAYTYASVGVDSQPVTPGLIIGFVDTDYTSSVANQPVLPETTAAVPEPATAGVLAVAGAGLLARRRRRSA